MNVTDIARVCHEINKAYCESIGDTSQALWDEAPQWQRSSAVNCVTFYLENQSAPPSASHDSWLKQKQEEGWAWYITDELPTEQKSKDYLFKQVIHSLKDFMEA